MENGAISSHVCTYYPVTLNFEDTKIIDGHFFAVSKCLCTAHESTCICMYMHVMYIVPVCRGECLFFVCAAGERCGGGAGGRQWM